MGHALDAKEMHPEGSNRLCAGGMNATHGRRVPPERQAVPNDNTKCLRDTLAARR